MNRKQLVEQIFQKKTFLCVGLDPDIRKMPECVQQEEDPIFFFNKPDFIELWSRRAILPLIVAAVIFGFGVQLAGGPETATAKLLADLSSRFWKAPRPMRRTTSAWTATTWSSPPPLPILAPR